LTCVGPSSEPRFCAQWRPFTGPLSNRSVAQALTVVRSMAVWLVAMRYLAFNPFVAVPVVRGMDAAAAGTELSLDADRYLSGGQWRLLREYLDDLAVDEAGLRARFAVTLAYTTGLRASELVAATTGRLRLRASVEADPSDEGSGSQRAVALHEVGKGAKVRDVPVAPELVMLLDEYLAARGLRGWHECAPDALLLSAQGATAPGRAIATSSLYPMLRAWFDALARTLNAGQRRED